MAILALAWAVQAPGGLVPPGPAPAGSVDVRGRIACLDEAGRRQDCGAGPTRFALEDRQGRLHPFLAADTLAGIFKDRRVRDRDLVVRARPAEGGALEIIKVFTVKDGTLYDVHYFCEICHIAAYVPGPCPCCGRDMELRETPLP
jgi:hypothetical protein